MSCRASPQRSPHPLVVGVNVTDPDAPGHYHLVVASAALARRLAGNEDLAALRAKHRGALCVEEIVQWHAPHAYHDPASGKVSLSSGYDPRHPEGRLERAIWALVGTQAAALIAADVRDRRRASQDERP